MAQEVIDVGELVEGRALGRFQLGVALLGFLVLWVDGLDNSAVPVTAPALVRAFHVGRGAMGVVFGAGSVGALAGSVLFGYAADRRGRKRAIIASVFAYALATFGSAFAPSIAVLTVLRFVTGLGIAGVVPTTIALLTEWAPRRFRAQFIMLSLLGIAAGNAAAGLLGAALLPHFGWRAVFLASGAIGLALGVALVAALPESLRWLALTAPDAPALRRLVARLAPERALGGARFALAETRRSGVALRALFAEDRRLATPLLWTGYFAEALTFYTLLSWMTVFLTSAGIGQRAAALTFSYASMGGIAAVLVMSRLIDRIGPASLVASACAALLSVATMGAPHLPHWALASCAVLAVTFCTGTHNALNGTVGLFYPTSLRGKGVGYATGLGRIGLSIGPAGTGYLLAVNLPFAQVLGIAAAPYAAVALACGMLGRLYQRRFAAGRSSEAAEVPNLQHRHRELSSNDTGAQ